ncbi:4Fe-4S dicluster domain-containing protein [Texcoconibacillus texcoconensis]|uniref:Formate dehydrogenase iron-sulfur subunit n=1 Tax=Texcoconibacillus texcoconensis TaxID=1095777 RepID=A0A840QN76_9BACI|nr:4Fe-4S dicluster domain-containing protein [Texcoconibacillus texcoconensis]MBB5172835.1 formate dehydrogenase iron-sulfur subunit [Texcoconibacillus texcoconensis]
MTTYSKLVDVTVCTGCRACMVACKNWNDLPVETQAYSGGYQSHEKPTGKTWNVLQMKEHETANGGFEWLYRHSACYHCADAACEKVCPEGAITYGEFGSVDIDQEACVGCSYCVYNCPFDIVELADYVTEDGDVRQRAQKCTLCEDRLQEGLQPSCVDTCPLDAIVFGEREEMLKLAEERLEKAKQFFPNAQIYNPPGVGGTKMFYVLADKPSVYGLPENPEVPTSAVLWKDIAQPAGKALLGVTMMGVLTGYVTNKLFNKGEHHEEGGEVDESKHG